MYGRDGERKEEKREGQKEEKKEGRERGKERKGPAIFSRQAYSQPPLAECLVNQSSFSPSFFQTLSPWADLCPSLVLQLQLFPSVKTPFASFSFWSLFMTLTSLLFKVKVANLCFPKGFNKCSNTYKLSIIWEIWITQVQKYSEWQLIICVLISLCEV